MYGFGAAADVVMYIPFLRNIMGWLSGGPASYKALKDGLMEVNVPIILICILSFIEQRHSLKMHGWILSLHDYAYTYCFFVLSPVLLLDRESLPS
jgi:hypothetical protein